MKPNPFSALNHFTVPVAMMLPLQPAQTALEPFPGSHLRDAPYYQRARSSATCSGTTTCPYSLWYTLNTFSSLAQQQECLRSDALGRRPGWETLTMAWAALTGPMPGWLVRP